MYMYFERSGHWVKLLTGWSADSACWEKHWPGYSVLSLINTSVPDINTQFSSATMFDENDVRNLQSSKWTISLTRIDFKKAVRLLIKHWIHNQSQTDVHGQILLVAISDNGVTLANFQRKKYFFSTGMDVSSQLVVADIGMTNCGFDRGWKCRKISFFLLC